MMTFFSVSGLDLLDSLHSVDTTKIRRWIESAFTTYKAKDKEATSSHSDDDGEDHTVVLGGFRPGPFLGLPRDKVSVCISLSLPPSLNNVSQDQCSSCKSHNPLYACYDVPHLAMMYTANATLRIIDRYNNASSSSSSSEIDNESMLRTLAHMQTPQGRYVKIYFFVTVSLDTLRDLFVTDLLLSQLLLMSWIH